MFESAELKQRARRSIRRAGIISIALHAALLFAWRLPLGAAPELTPPKSIKVELLAAPRREAPVTPPAPPAPTPATPPTPVVAVNPPPATPEVKPEPPKVEVPPPAVEPVKPVVDKPKEKPKKSAKPVEKKTATEKPVEPPPTSPPTLPAPATSVTAQAPASPAVPIPAPAQPPAGEGPANAQGKDAANAKGEKAVRAEPDYARSPQPEYPASARRRKAQGVVLLAVHVSAAGRAESVTLKKSCGFEALDDAAIEAVRGWTFKPARMGDTAIEADIEVPVRFKLTN